MSEMHTPWVAHQERHGLFVSEGSLVVASLGDGQTEGQQDRAKLIAAAPDLLAELRAVEHHLCRYVEAIEWGGGSASLSAERLASVRAAIAKAEGRT